MHHASGYKSDFLLCVSPGLVVVVVSASGRSLMSITLSRGDLRSDRPK